MNRPTRQALLVLAALGVFFYASYGLANHLALQRVSVPSVVFDWERHIPFWAWTVFPYWSLNVFYALSLLLVRSRHELRRHALRLLAAQLVAVTCFMLWPLAFSFGRPAVDAHSPAGWLFTALRGFDQPFNQAPSLHITLTVILWDLYRRLLPRGWPQGVLHVWALAICGSVLTTWQHHFIDLPTGALLGLLCVWAWPLERRVAMPQAWRITRCPLRLQLAGAYALGAAACAAVAALVGGTALWLLWPAAALLLVAANYAGLGARGFQMDDRGRMGWAARVLLAPYRLGAVINGRLWTCQAPAARELLPGVWITSLARRQPSAGDRPAPMLLSLCAELQAPTAQGGQHTRCLPWLDLVPASPRALRQAAALIDDALARHGCVQVGCALGVSRSAAALACWLARSGRARHVDDALAQMQRLHPAAVLGMGWRAALQQAVVGCAPGGRQARITGHTVPRVAP